MYPYHNRHGLGVVRQHRPPSICSHNLKQRMSGSSLTSWPSIEAARECMHRTQILLYTRNARDSTPSTTSATLPPRSITKPHLAQPMLHRRLSLYPHQALTSSTSSHLFPHLPFPLRTPDKHMEARLQLRYRNTLLRLPSTAHLRRISLKPDVHKILDPQTIHKMRKHLATKVTSLRARNSLLHKPLCHPR